jgi:hypothetical protein
MVTATGIAVRREASPTIRSKLPKHSTELERYAFSIGNGIPRLTKKVSDFPDVGEVTLAGHEELPEEIDSKDKQKR